MLYVALRARVKAARNASPLDHIMLALSVAAVYHRENQNAASR